MKNVALIIFLIFIISSSVAQNAIICNPKDGISSLTITGSSNVSDFRLKQNTAHFLKQNQKLILKRIDDKVYVSDNELNIPIKYFTTDNLLILYNFRRMLHADQCSNLKIRLIYVLLPEGSKTGKTSNIIAKIEIEIAGKANTYLFPVVVTLSDKSFHIDGTKQINIEDFDLSPPSTVLGLIKVNKWVDIRFSIFMDYTSN